MKELIILFKGTTLVDEAIDDIYKYDYDNKFISLEWEIVISLMTLRVSWTIKIKYDMKLQSHISLTGFQVNHLCCALKEE